MAENEAPSKTVLLERREERALVAEGKSVLEERRDTLAQAIMAELDAITPRRDALARRLADAEGALRAAAQRHAPGGLRRLAEATSKLPEPNWRVTNYFGTRMVSAPSLTSEPPLETRWDSTVDAARARVAFHRLLEVVVDLAPRLNNLSRLAAEFRRTQRKVNALEHVIVPELTQSIHEIEFVLEEMERENMVRALHVKKTSARRR